MRTRAISAIVLVLLVVPLAAAQLAQSPQMPSATPAPAATPAAVRGRVTDLHSGQPIPRAVVTIRFLGPGSLKQETVADAEGRYAFANLPPGSYRLHAEPPSGSSHVSRSYGHTERFDPLRFDSTAAPLQLSSGDEVSAVIELPRAYVVAGRIVVPEGRPVQSIRIGLRDANGSLVVRTDIRTDPEGRFRIAGVRAGDYRVCAIPGMNVALIRTAGRFEGEQLLETCQPALVDSADLSDVEIAVQFGLVYSIAGSIVDAAGAPVSSDSLQLTRRNGPESPGIDIRRSENQFLIRGVPPGDYLLTARRMVSPPTATEMGFVSLRVADADMEDVMIRTAPPVSVAGRVAFAEGPPLVLPKVNVNTIGQRVMKPGASENVWPVRGDLTFQIDGLFGPQMLQVFGAMRPWAVSSIRYRGEEIYGRAVELRSSVDPNQLVVTLTNRSASVSTRLRDTGKHPTAGLTVALIPIDPATGTVLENAIFRPLGADAPSALPAVRPGDYLIAAVAPEDAWGPPASVVARIAKVATPIRLAPGEQRVIELDVVRPR